MIVIEKGQVYSSNGKVVHRIGSEVYFSRSTVLKSDTIADFEEVDSIPKYTKSEYDAKVAELVREKYSESEEFALQRKMLNTLISPMTLSDEVVETISKEYAAYNEYVEQCKADAPQAIIDQKEREEAERQQYQN